MAIYDRWHRDPAPGDEACKHGRGRNRLYPSADHEAGDRWQVRWRDPATGKQKKRNFALRDGTDPNRHADAFDKYIQGKLVTKTYTDPRAGEVSLAEYAEQRRKARNDPNPETAENVERALRLHVYEDPGRPGSGRTPRGGVAIGQYPMALLATQPSLVADWAAAIQLAPGPRANLMRLVSWIFRVAIGDGVVGRDPTRADGVKWPKAAAKRARAWSYGQVEAMRAELPDRWRVMLDLGAGTGMRQGEMLGLGVGDVDWLKKDDPRVHVVRQLRRVGGRFVFAPVKNRKAHDVPLAPEVRDRLAAHLGRFPAVTVTLPWEEPEDKDRHGKPLTVRLILTSPRGTPAFSTTLSDTWRAAALRAGVTPDGARVREDGCHALRHTFASTCLRNRIDVVRVAAWMGDTVEMVTTTYAHLLPDDDDSDGRTVISSFFTAPPGESPSDQNVTGESAN